MIDEITLRPASGPVRATLTIPGSKSITNRALLLAALSAGRSRLSGLLHSDDTEAMVDSLSRLGFAPAVDWSRGTASLDGAAGRIPADDADLDCREAATVSRFLIAACATATGTYRFGARGSMLRRPIGPLVAALEKLGAAFEPASAETLPVALRASGLRGGTLAIDSSVSSQFTSALLMAAPLASSQLELVADGEVSRSYVELTRSLMRDFGVEVTGTAGGRYRVPAAGHYRAADLTVEADASTASYFFAAAAATGGRVTVANLRRDESLQADVQFLDVLERMGCTIESGAEGTTVQGGGRLRGVDVDMKDFSDTFMTVACLAPLATGPSTIRGIEHTRVKESDRIACTVENLRRLGVGVEEVAGGIRIEPATPRGGVVESCADHRQAMSFSVLSLVTPGVTIRGAGSVAKTAPSFFQLWSSLAPG